MSIDTPSKDSIRRLPTDWKDLLKSHKLSAHGLVPRLLKEGGNNRLFELESSSTKYALKQYDVSARSYDLRMRREYEFLKHANIYAEGTTPKALGIDFSNGLLLMSHIEGDKVLRIQNSSSHLEKAIDFIKFLNPEARRNSDVNLIRLPTASEAAFSISDHIDVVANRLHKLHSLEIVGETADRFRGIIQPLHESWPQFVNLAKHQCQYMGISYNNNLAKKYQCVSPSDFGFHNAISKKNGEICFIDFEYAGVDDPAKLVCDFFEQVAVPIPIHNYDYFVDKLSCHFDFDELRARTSILRPFYCIKWICILLNIFNKEGVTRKNFSGAGKNVEMNLMRETQLKKAEVKMNKLRGEYSFV